jgi:FkbM family methyltransferase
MQLTKINGKYELWLPDHRAARPEWLIENGGWEVKRTEEVLKALNPDSILFEVGVVEGDLTALFVKYSGCKVVMFEPNNRVWSCIKSIWEANELDDPIDLYRGFLSSKSTKDIYDVAYKFSGIGDDLIPDHGFKQLYENYPDVPQMTLDEYCDMTERYPTVINVDIEGSEFEFIKGAEKTLRERKPIIFMSIHPEFMYESYRNGGIWKERYGERQHVVHLLRFIDELGYTHEIIEWDYHECHAKFIPK